MSKLEGGVPHSTDNVTNLQFISNMAFLTNTCDVAEISNHTFTNYLKMRRYKLKLPFIS